MQILEGRLFIGASVIGSRQKDRLGAWSEAIPFWFKLIQEPGVQNKMSQRRRSVNTYAWTCVLELDASTPLDASPAGAV